MGGDVLSSAAARHADEPPFMAPPPRESTASRARGRNHLFGFRVLGGNFPGKSQLLAGAAGDAASFPASNDVL